jgi:uncharacterized protein (TIGR02246 family)
MNTQFKTVLRISQFLLLFTFIVSLIIACTNQESASNDEIEKTILALEKGALDKWANGDPVGFSSNFAEDATYLDDIGAANGIEGAEEIKSYFEGLQGNIPQHKYEIESPRIQVYGDMAILTLRYNASSPENEPGPPWKATSVYRLTNDQWKVVHANWSLIKGN